MPTAIPADDITAVILAGGKARRMNGEDKGLIALGGQRLIEYIITALRPQTDSIIVNANRHLDVYAGYGLPVVADILGNYLGPLAGMASGMQATDRPWVVTVPCDSPFIPADLLRVLSSRLTEEQADICVAHDGERMQPVFAMLRCSLLPDLLHYLEGGGRKIDHWYATQRLAIADFSGSADTFLNLNSPQDRQLLEQRLASRS
jgi:molybdopterin-guanine dinucleotide biosynthesis protein A